MKRLMLAALSFALLPLALPSSAYAHGGVFRGPGGAIPPGLRPPSDPTPPPPPPVTQGPPETTPSDPMRPPPGTTNPVAPPPPPVTTDPGSGGPNRPKRAAVTHDSWVYWWASNAPEILRLKEALYRLRTSPDSPLGAIGNAAGNESDATRATEKETRAIVVPALLKLIAAGAPGSDLKVDEDARSSALLALAKVTDDPAHARTILAAVVDKETGKRNGIEPVLVRESAALALGLLRRSPAAKRFDGREYDAVRDACFAIFEDEDQAPRTRCFAMFSVGMLGDAPTRRGVAATDGAAPATGAVEPDASARIVSLLDRRYTHPDYPIALLVALGLQPPTSVPPAVQDLLEQATLRARWGKTPVDSFTSSYAALALGRVGGPERSKPLLLALTARSMTPEVRRSAAIALGRVGLRLDAPDRRALVEDVARSLPSVNDTMAQAFGWMSVARLLAEEAESGSPEALLAKGARAAEDMIRLADDGPYALRSYGALALGLVLRSVGDRPDELGWAAWAEKAKAALRRGFESPSLDARNRAAFAVGLGLAKDLAARKALLAAVADGNGDSELRGYAAVAVGLLALPSKESSDVLERAMKDSRDDELRVQCAVGLGLLGTRGVVDLLLDELTKGGGQVLLGQVVLALGRIGDARVLPRLVGLAMDRTTPDPVRAMAVACLGLVGDLEPVPTLALLSTDVNYRATTDSLAEALTIL